MARPVCPSCKHSHCVRPAHRRTLDSLWRRLGRYAYRCDSCSTRFYRFLRPPHGQGSHGRHHPA